MSVLLRVFGARSLRVCVPLLIAAMAVALSGAPLADAATATVIRLAGGTRYQTGVAVSEEGWPSATHVIIATGASYPDALAGAPLAQEYGGPLLLTSPTSLPASVSAEIDRLGATNAIILGGTKAVAASVETQLRSKLGTANVERIAGASRYDTAAQVALRLRDRGALGGRIVVATGSSYADALAAAGFAAKKGYPILLTRRDTIPPETQAAITSLGATSTIVVGGAGAVSDPVKSALPSAIRLAGATRYATAATIASYAATNGCSFDTVVVATGQNYPDALAGGPLGALHSGVMLLTPSTSLCAEAENCIIDNATDIDTVYILGGLGVVYPGVVDQIEDDLSAAGLTWSAARRISRDADYYVNYLDAERDAAGRVGIVWQEGTTLWFRQLDRRGNTLIPTFALPASPVTSAGTGGSYPQIAVAPDGRITVLWRYSGTSSTTGLYALQLDECGRLLRGPVKLVAASTRWPDLSAGEEGDVHLTYRGEGYRPYYARLTRDLEFQVAGTPLTAVMRDYFTLKPAVLPRAGGVADVVWYDARDFTTHDKFHLYHSRLAWTGGSALPPGSGSIDQAKLTTKADGYIESDPHSSSGDSGSRRPSVSVGSGDKLHIAWIENAQDLWFERLDADGSVGVAPVRLVDGSSFSGKCIALGSARDDGGTDIVFNQYHGSSIGSRLTYIGVSPSGAAGSAGVRIPGAVYEPWVTSLVRNPSGDLQLLYCGGASTYEKLYYLDTARDAASWDTARCDLVVDGAYGRSSNSIKPKEGQTVTMTVKVSNFGWTVSPPTVATFAFGATHVATVTVPALAVEASTSVSAAWTVPASWTVDPATATVRVDPLGAVSECSEGNNTLEHPVPVQVRPSGTGVWFHGMDETYDASHTLGWYGTDHIRATLSGTLTEPPYGAFSRTVDLTGTGAPGYFGTVPPGDYSLSYVVTGCVSPYSPIAVAVSRVPTDPYQFRVTPSEHVMCWCNTWGQIDGVVYDDKGTPSGLDDSALASATVTVAETGRSAMTDHGGEYLFEGVAAGVYHVSVKRDGYTRVRDLTVTVGVGEGTKSEIWASPTTKAYLDVFVGVGYGAPLPGATVKVHNASHVTQATAYTDTAGMARFEVNAGSSLHVNVSDPLYLTQDLTGQAFTPIAGREYRVDVDPLLVNTALIERAGTDWHEWDTFNEYFRLYDNESLTSYRNFKARFDIDYADDGGGRKVLGAHAYAQGLQFMVERMTCPVDIEVFGIPIEVFDVESQYESRERSNVWLRRLQVVDSATGDVLGDSGDLTAFSGSSPDKVAAAHVALDEYVAWADVRVYLWLSVEKEDMITGEYVPSPLGGRGANRVVLVYDPYAGDTTVEPWLFDP